MICYQNTVMFYSFFTDQGTVRSAKTPVLFTAFLVPNGNLKSTSSKVNLLMALHSLKQSTFFVSLTGR